MFYPGLIFLVLVNRKGHRGSLCKHLLCVPNLYKKTEAFGVLPLREKQWFYLLKAWTVLLCLIFGVVSFNRYDSCLIWNIFILNNWGLGGLMLSLWPLITSISVCFTQTSRKARAKPFSNFKLNKVCRVLLRSALEYDSYFLDFAHSCKLPVCKMFLLKSFLLLFFSEFVIFTSQITLCASFCHIWYKKMLRNICNVIRWLCLKHLRTFKSYCLSPAVAFQAVWRIRAQS